MLMPKRTKFRKNDERAEIEVMAHRGNSLAYGDIRYQSC